MDLLQAVFTSQSSLEIKGGLIGKNGFSILITCFHHKKAGPCKFDSMIEHILPIA